MSNISKAFKTARHRVAIGEEFICNALNAHPDTSAAFDAKNIIRDRLQGYHTLDDWLRANGYLTNLSPSVIKQQLRLYRIRWLNALIKEFK